ncbi:AraC-like protein [Flavobacterium cutihirudinis]|uniref:AraC-like protein n=1 Tax=Flavobacterium cutihirudinis TaxID=1265740 RepID=A0A3D9FTB9_9FLAO|nr:AraC family transcriptional regulator [Flavobacterium cutihirudinis]RED23867.1 AraC-like protein [Flavobacterium cutihirudinis]
MKAKKTSVRKKEGFKGQKSIVLPNLVVDRLSSNPINRFLYVTDIGFYPQASNHYRQRKQGSSENILIYCIGGKGWCKIENQLYTIKPNQFLIVPVGLAHTYSADKDDPWTIYWIHFKGEGGLHLATNLYEKLIAGENMIYASEVRNNLFEELYKNLQLGYGKSNTGYASILLWQILGSFLYDERFGASLIQEQSDPIEKAITYISENIQRRLTLEMISEQANLSLSHFSMLFKNKTGYTPIEYVNHLKIQTACQNLQFTNLRIKEIAELSGIEDPYYFSRVFNSLMGVSPTQYRQQFSQAEADSSSFLFKNKS